jgi:enolase
MATLQALKARQVLDSRGRPTVEVEAMASTGARGRAIVPSGASTGRHEALELRDAEVPRYGGLGVLRAADHVNREIAAAVAGMDLDDQGGLDARLIALDGTPNKSRLGANAVLGVSLAAAHAAAAARGEELFVHLNRLWRQRLDAAGTPAATAGPALPMPMVNMISGGLHAGGNLDIQDVLIIPVGATTYSAALEMTVAVYRAVGAVLRERGFESVLVGDEGGYGPRLRDDEQALEVVGDALLACGFEPGRDVAIAVDVAASHFFDPDRGTYRLRATGGRDLDGPGLVDLLAGWVQRYPIVSIEDGLAEDDWDGWAALTARLGASVQLIGDDLFATQVDRLRRGIDRRAGNAVLIKLNQVGTLTETFDAILLARQHGFRTIVSARSGETEDITIADLAVATAAGQIKIGSVARSERLAKYNRLLRIEEALGADAHFPVTEVDAVQAEAPRLPKIDPETGTGN